MARFENDLQKFRMGFEFSSDEMNSFKNFAIDKGVELVEEDYFAIDKGVELVEEDYNNDKDYIFTRLKAQVARNYWKNKGWYTVLLDIDTQFLKSVTLFDEAKDLADLK
jgi:hypothetical protein